jgi:ubiquinone/menaquinone biosynthesis C-methylase UbiE
VTSFSEQFPAGVYVMELREQKARTIKAVLADFLKNPLHSKLLDVGSSTGAISYSLAESFERVVGVDVDRSAMAFAVRNFKKPNLSYGLIDGTRLPFGDSVFDVATCTHIYEHCNDPQELLDEIHRVLKPGGVCYFTAGNRLWPIEFHYRLPFLSWLTPSISNLYLRVFGLGRIYDVRLLTLRSLRKLVEKFSVTDYTQRIADNPVLFHAEYMLPVGSLRQKLARFTARYAYWLFPTYVWVLVRRPESPAAARD